jgi:hypothetical protein
MVYIKLHCENVIEYSEENYMSINTSNLNETKMSKSDWNE